MNEMRPPALGTLRDRVQLQRKDQTVSAEGGLATSFVTLANLWARVRALSPTWTATADGRAARASHTIVVRFRSDISVGDVFVYQGRPLEILSAEDLNGRRAYLSCRCTQYVQAG